jgi:hypothetical protein
MGFYIDENLNQIMDADEEIFQEVKYKRHHRRNQDGSLHISSIPSGTSFEVTPNTLNSEDPFVHMPKKTHQFYMHSGGMVDVDVPVYRVGGLEGFIYYKDQDKQNEFGRVRVVLIDAHGEQIAEAHSYFDGYYSMDNIPMGEYTLRYTSRFFEQPKEQVIQIRDWGTYKEVGDMLFEVGVDK